MTAEPMTTPGEIGQVEIDHITWIECPRCHALNLMEDGKCFICHLRLHYIA
ncbi:MAG: hypothetical protein KAT70_04650 [Thermoplasmata archaeon]|nr:hypothetical protein [Thermoplasmata archaeon]